MSKKTKYCTLGCEYAKRIEKMGLMTCIRPEFIDCLYDKETHIGGSVCPYENIFSKNGKIIQNKSLK